MSFLIEFPSADRGHACAADAAQRHLQTLTWDGGDAGGPVRTGGAGTGRSRPFPATAASFSLMFPSVSAGDADRNAIATTRSVHTCEDQTPLALAVSRLALLADFGLGDFKASSLL